MRFSRKVTIITGAGSGLGAAASRLFGAEGASLILIDYSEVRLSKVAQEIGEKTGSEVHQIVGDVSLDRTAQQAVDTAKSRFGRLDIVVNNAAINPVGSLVDTDEETWDRIMGVNLKAAYLMAHRGIPLMAKGGGGVIVNIASTAVFKASYKEAAYGISKAGLVHLTRTLARDFAADNIRAIAINPGFLPTYTQDRLPNMTEAHREARSKKAAEMVPLGREGTYEEYANVVAFLASDDASYITGTSIVVDGGLTA